MTATAWSEQELAEVDSRSELLIASLRQDGTLSGSRIIWAVRLGDDVYVRSVNGPGSAWFRGTRARHEGRVQVGGLTKDVTFVDVDEADEIEDRIDAAYRSKYGAHSGPVARITADQARATTLKLVAR